MLYTITQQFMTSTFKILASLDRRNVQHCRRVDRRRVVAKAEGAKLGKSKEHQWIGLEQRQTMVPSEHGNCDSWLALTGALATLSYLGWVGWEATTRELTASTTMAILGWEARQGRSVSGSHKQNLTCKKVLVPPYLVLVRRGWRGLPAILFGSKICQPKDKKPRKLGF
jgi:hypothetical protein